MIDITTRSSTRLKPLLEGDFSRRIKTGMTIEPMPTLCLHNKILAVSLENQTRKTPSRKCLNKVCAKFPKKLHLLTIFGATSVSP